MAPLDQLAWWRFLIYRGDAETVLLPFVDAAENPVCFINDASGPTRAGAAPNVAFLERGKATVVMATEDVSAGDVLVVDYGDAYWDFEPVLAQLGERLESFAAVFAHLRRWLDVAALGGEADGGLLTALKREFPAPGRRLRTMARGRDYFDPEDPSEGGASAWGRAGRRSPAFSSRAEPDDDRRNDERRASEEAREKAAACASRKKDLVAYLRDAGGDAIAAAGDAEFKVKCTRRPDSSGPRRSKLDFYFYSDDLQFRSRCGVARHYGVSFPANRRSG